MGLFTPVTQEIDKYWKLSEFQQLVERCEAVIAPVAEKHKLENDYINILLFSFSRAVITVNEVLVLLEYGYPDGALARARTLFEEKVILNFLENKKTSAEEFDNTIQKYHDDYYVSAYNNLVKFHHILGQEALETEFICKLDELKQKHGVKNFCNQYWWSGKKSFHELLNDCKLNNLMKIFYNRACLSTHAGAYGNATLLGRQNENGNILYSGATAVGFSAPLLLSSDSFIAIIAILFFNLEISYGTIIEEAKALNQYYVEKAENDMR